MVERVWRRRAAAVPPALLTAAAEAGLAPLLTTILYGRNLDNVPEMRAFLNPAAASPLDPFLLPDMRLAVARLRRALVGGERIAVYGDFDADGVTATTLLVEVLQLLGGDVEAYIPHRVDEGYGLHATALPTLLRHGVKVVVTADCGVSGVAEVEIGRRYGLEFVITDHHEPHPRLPAAAAVVNPKRADSESPFRELSGVGVAYKLAQALVAEMRPELAADVEAICLDLVAIGTIADVVPLVAENRRLAHLGLRVLNGPRRTLRPGLAALMEVAGVKEGHVSEWHVGFLLAPRLNAAGRMADARTALALLTTRSSEEAGEGARRLDEHNRERQRLTDEGVQVARVAAEGQLRESPVLVVQDESFAVGVVGLIAARLVEEFNRPAVVLARDGKRWRGSARSVPGFDIGAALARCSDLLAKHGGHPMAAGLTIQHEMLPELRRRLNQLGEEQLSGVDPRPVLTVDAELSLREVQQPLYQSLRRLAPHGMGNPEPVFWAADLEVARRRTVGARGAHLRLTLRDKGGFCAEAIGFGMGALTCAPRDRVDVAFCLSENDWNGQTEIELRLRDVVPAGTAFASDSATD